LGFNVEKLIYANKIMISVAIMSIPIGIYDYQGVIINVERHVWIKKLEK
jgi:hypothetical protein